MVWQLPDRCPRCGASAFMITNHGHVQRRTVCVGCGDARITPEPAGLSGHEDARYLRHLLDRHTDQG